MPFVGYCNTLTIFRTEIKVYSNKGSVLLIFLAINRDVLGSDNVFPTNAIISFEASNRSID
jgi:hypothetical protein